MKVKNPGLFGFHFYKSATYYAFHDESIPNKRWFLIGLLLVKEQDLQDIRDFLKRIKEKNHCESEIHFSKLPKSFDGDYSSKAKVAREWMYLYQNTLKDYAMPTVLIVDKQSETFQSDRFAKDFHIYNRFTALALKCAISWHLRKENYDEVLKSEKVDYPKNVYGEGDASQRIVRILQICETDHNAGAVKPWR